MSRLIDADKLKAWFFRPYSNEESYSNLDVAKVIDAQPTATRWVRCEDELPKNVANRVLVYCQNGVMYAAHYEGGETDKWYMNMGTWWEEGTGNLTVTHWMPLPEPPKEGEN